jgi:predicted 3-demethylubiquinone-9 3-methyltransferase (glyoxalase superfamily)
MNEHHFRFSHGLWFDHQAEEAARLYTSIFPDSHTGHITRYGKEGFEYHGRPEGSVMAIEFTLSGLKFIALNGGPKFQFNPSISFFVICDTTDETDRTWQQLAHGGKILLPLDHYDWSERYGWVQDRFGITWEISFGKLSDVGQRITPTLLFAGPQHGRAEEAVKYYTSIFPKSAVAGILRYKTGESEPEGTVKHAMFSLYNHIFMALDNAAHPEFVFNDAITIMINCITQKQIDYYWSKLTDGGEEGPCGWLKDRFGVSWQIEPVQLQEMLRHPDPEKVRRVSAAFMEMKKFDIRRLEKAFNG